MYQDYQVMDNLDTKTRSKIMSSIRARDTAPEVLVRRFFWRLGLRYRLHVKSLPGRPDIVFHKEKVVVEVRGCFWHGHEGCPKFVWPSSRKDFWKQKISETKRRDTFNAAALENLGWKVFVVWECALKDKNGDNLTPIVFELRRRRNAATRAKTR